MKNEKGFAITTLVYGLSILGFLVVLILMGTMSTSRANNRELAKAVERELNKNSVTDVAFDGSKATDGDYLEEIYVIPYGQGGWFRVELWGASGTNGRGAYTSGFIRLEEGDTLHFYVGKKRTGKETDLRLISGGYDERSSYESRIMVAAGGGNASGANGGTLEGYTNLNPVVIPKTSRGIKGVGGGDGFFPSTATNHGGTSYISGYGGAASIYQNTVYPNNPTYVHCPVVYNDNADTYSYPNCNPGQADPTIGRKYFFRDGIMLPAVNTGDGKAKIERISPKDTVERHNTNMLDVKEIIDCVDGTSNSTTKISAMINGQEKGITITPTDVGDPESRTGTKCKHINISRTDLDEIATFHALNENPDNHRIIIRKNDNSIAVLKKAVSESNKKSETSSPTGYRISAYQHDSTTSLPAIGTYYIIPISTMNQVLNSGNPVVASLLSGTLTQKWQIEKNADGTTYKIIESSNNKAITESSSKAISTTGYNGTNSSSKWKILPLGNGLYRIQNQSTNHYMAYDASNSQILCNTSTGTETLFKLYKIDLS